jgi:hypothetical protein
LLLLAHHPARLLGLQMQLAGRCNTFLCAVFCIPTQQHPPPKAKPPPLLTPNRLGVGAAPEAAAELAVPKPPVKPPPKPLLAAGAPKPKPGAEEAPPVTGHTRT